MEWNDYGLFYNYSASPATEWAVPQSSRLKYRQLFNSHDKTMSGHLTGIGTYFKMKNYF